VVPGQALFLDSLFSQDDADAAHEASINTIMLIVGDEGQRGAKRRRPYTGRSQHVRDKDEACSEIEVRILYRY
jgi:hypothetical protein